MDAFKAVVEARGIAPEKIIEIFLQSIPYTDFSKVLNAVSVAKKIFEN